MPNFCKVGVKKHKLQSTMRKPTNFLNMLLSRHCCRALHIHSIHNADCYYQIRNAYNAHQQKIPQVDIFKTCGISFIHSNCHKYNNSTTIRIRKKNYGAYKIILQFPLMLFIKRYSIVVMKLLLLPALNLVNNQKQIPIY